MSIESQIGVRSLVRWMLKEDLETVLRIEQESFEFPWTESEFLACIQRPNCIAMVAVVQEKVVGYMIYEMGPQWFQILNLAVDAEYRRHGVGRVLVQRLINKLSPRRRHRITLHVRETNLPAQLFFKAIGFRAKAILHDHYPDTAEDAYLMTYELVPHVTVSPRNRVAEFFR